MERKEEVKEARKRLKEEGFTKFFITPTVEYWKKKPLHAFLNFFIYALITYIIFCGIQAVNNDMIYCDSSNDLYDGKLMQVYNPYVNWVNTNSPTIITDQNIMNFNLENLEPSIAQESTIVCDYDLKKWWNEPIKERKTIITNWLTIMRKK